MHALRRRIEGAASARHGTTRRAAAGGQNLKLALLLLLPQAVLLQQLLLEQLLLLRLQRARPPAARARASASSARRGAESARIGWGAAGEQPRVTAKGRLVANSGAREPTARPRIPSRPPAEPELARGGGGGRGGESLNSSLSRGLLLISGEP